jgi:hypothetical protein
MQEGLHPHQIDDISDDHKKSCNSDFELAAFFVSN